MLKFVARTFEGFFGIFLWLNLIGSSITGIICGWEFGENSWDSGAGGAFLGFILGTIIGILTNIIFGGLVAIFVKMGKELSEVKQYVEEISSGNTVNNGAGTAPAVSAPVAARSSTVVDTSFEEYSADARDPRPHVNDTPFEVYSGTCKSCGHEVNSSSTDVRIYKICDHCGARL